MAANKEVQAALKETKSEENSSILDEPICKQKKVKKKA
jgi:hypothetical protein